MVARNISMWEPEIREIRARVTQEHEKTTFDRPCQTNRDLLKGLGKNILKEHLAHTERDSFLTTWCSFRDSEA